MVVIVRSLTGACRGAIRSHHVGTPTLVIHRNLQMSATRFNSKPTGSEESVHAEKHDAGPEELQKKTAQKAQATKHHSSASPNDHPTSSEDSVHADKHEHDPLPDHKKKSKGGGH